MRAFVRMPIIKPYYLHHGDLAPGTAHLRATLEHGQELMVPCEGGSPAVPAGLRARHSRRHGKAPVGPSYLSQANSLAGEGELDPENGYRVVDYCGDVHALSAKAVMSR